MQLDPERLLRLDRPGPRYTSYPTAPTWRTDCDPEELRRALTRIRPPVSVYVHIPFCREQCTFCGCNMVVAGRRSAGDRYLDALERQVDGLPLPSETVDAVRIHLGGGTPTWLSVAQLERLYELIHRRFTTGSGAEVSVEIDPDVTTDEQIDVLAALGVNRLSIGVQSFDPAVLAAIGRPQDERRVGAILGRARALGMWGLNLDLVYGLPHQTKASFADTLERVVELKPDRLAIYGYAHVPWLKGHQRKLDEQALPSPVERMALALAALGHLTAAGYQPIGMDHYALPNDELAVAQRAGTLHRNFMGYTTRGELDLVGLGMSAITETREVYAQQPAHLAAWYRGVERELVPFERGWWVTSDDRLRRAVIAQLMCNFVVRFGAVEREFGIDFRTTFARELESLAELEAEGLVVVNADRVEVTPVGRLVVRNVAMVFDAYLVRGDRAPRFSRTV